MDLLEFTAGYILRHDVSPNYGDQLKWCVAALSRYLGWKAGLDDLTSTTINEWLYHMKEKQYAAETRRARRRMLLTLASDAARQRLIEPVHRDLVARVKSAPRLPDGFTHAQAKQVIHAVTQRGGPYEKWLRYRYQNSHLRRRDWWRAYLLACWDTGAPADLRRLEFDDIRDNGNVVMLRSKTGKPLRWRLSEGTLFAIEQIREPHREPVFPLSGSLNLFRREARKIIQEIAGFPDKSLGGFRSGAGTDAEFVHGPGAGSQLLGNTPAVFSRHYEIASVLDRAAPSPRPLVGKEATWPTDHSSSISAPPITISTSSDVLSPSDGR